jgi:hypothetical protein
MSAREIEDQIKIMYNVYNTIKYSTYNRLSVPMYVRRQNFYIPDVQSSTTHVGEAQTPDSVPAAMLGGVCSRAEKDAPGGRRRRSPTCDYRGSTSSTYKKI